MGCMMEVAYGRWNRWEKRYLVIRCVECHQPILLPLSFQSNAIAECERCGKKQCVLHEFDHEMQQWQYRVLPCAG